MSQHVGKRSKTTGLTSSDSSVWPVIHADGSLDGFWLSEAGLVDFDRIPVSGGAARLGPLSAA